MHFEVWDGDGLICTSSQVYKNPKYFKTASNEVTETNKHLQFQQ